MYWRMTAARLGALAGVAASLIAASPSPAAPCPQSGAALAVSLERSVSGPVTAIVLGNLGTASCEAADDSLATSYAQVLTCQPDDPETCKVEFDGLQPGTWVQRIAVSEGEASGQQQGRVELLLDRRAGVHGLAWPLYRSVQTVDSLGDASGCTGCLRAAIAAANAGPKPALVQFAPDLAGTIVLAAALPALSTGQVTIDGIDNDGVALTRTIDGNGRDAAALKITSDHNQILGLRVTEVGGNSDAVLIEGPSANGNLLDSLQVIGRAFKPCGTSGVGCMLHGLCIETTPQAPHGVCGDDGIAVRNFAGAGEANRISRCAVTAARDKGIKVSDRGVAVVERSLLIGNTDGGLQSTLGGSVSANENLCIANRGTTSANGLAVNGAAAGSLDPGQLQTRGNLSMHNALRGISVRSLSVAELHDDFVCGNGALGGGNGVGLAVLDAAGFSATASAAGIGVLHNADAGVVVSNASRASFAPDGAPGENAFAFNGRRQGSPMNFRNLSSLAVAAQGNAWEHCGAAAMCDVASVQALDVFSADFQAPVAVVPALTPRRRAAPRITEVSPSMAVAGELVHIYGTGFDAIDGAGRACQTIAAANTCRPLHGNCVFVGQVPAEVIAVTPTMLVIRAPFTCVEPVQLQARTRWSHGFGGAPFCVEPSNTGS